MSLLIAKIVSMVGLGLVTWIIGILPMVGVKKGWLKNVEQSPRSVICYSILLCFGGGVILTSCLTHMLPDVREEYVRAVAEGTFPDTGFEIPEILILAGFLMIYLIEEVAHAILEKLGILGHGSEDEEGEKEKGGHGHSHDFEVDPSDSIQATARGFLVILALCIHDLFEGITLGVCRQESAVWFLLLAFASHKYVIAACLGLKWASSALKPIVSVIYMTTFCVVSPIGVLIGLLLSSPQQESEMQNTALIILQGVATGSLLYVVFFEILEKERQKSVSGIIQALSFAGGYIFMVLLGFAEVQSEAAEGTLNWTAAEHNVTKMSF